MDEINTHRALKPKLEIAYGVSSNHVQEKSNVICNQTEVTRYEFKVVKM